MLSGSFHILRLQKFPIFGFDEQNSQSIRVEKVKEFLIRSENVISKELSKRPGTNRFWILSNFSSDLAFIPCTHISNLPVTGNPYTVILKINLVILDPILLI